MKKRTLKPMPSLKSDEEAERFVTSPRFFGSQ